MSFSNKYPIYYFIMEFKCNFNTELEKEKGLIDSP
jgi:hypothetical protein